MFQRRTALFVDLELDTAVVVTTFGGLVGVDRLAFAEALPSDALLGDTVLDEVVEDGLRAALGQTLVVDVGTHAVGMALDRGLDLRELCEPGDSLVEDRDGLSRQLGGVEVEQDDGLEGLVDFFHIGNLHGLFLDRLRFRLWFFLGGLVSDRREDLDGLLNLVGDLAEGELQAQRTAQVAAQSFTGREGRTVHERGLEVGDDIDAFADLDGHHETGTTGQGTIGHLRVTCMGVGHQEVEHAEEEVAMDVAIVVLAVVDILVGDLQTLVAGTETEHVAEVLTGVDVEGGTVATVGNVAVGVILTVKSDVKSAAGADEPVGRAVILGENAGAKQNGGGRCDKSSDIHNALGILKVERDTEGAKTAEVEREARIAFIGRALLILLGRLQAVESVGVSFTAEVSIDADRLGKQVLGDEAEAETEGIVRRGHVLALPRVTGVRVAIRMAESDTGVDFRDERTLRIVADVVRNVGEDADVLERIGEERMRIRRAGGLLHVVCARVVSNVGREAETGLPVEVVSGDEGALEGEQIHGLAFVTVREGVLVQGEHRAALDAEIERPLKLSVLREERTGSKRKRSNCDKEFLHDAL